MRGRIAAIAVVAAGLPAAGWLGVQERAAGAEAELDALAFDSRGEVGEAQLGEGRELLRTARRLNPDRRPDLYEAVLLGRAGRKPEAVAVLRRVVAAEPENVEAWGLLATPATGADASLAARARSRLRELSPPVPPG
jgi:predicted Zn-dependent protease